MRKLIKSILKEEIGGNYFYLIVTKDGKFYVSDGDGFEYSDILVPMDGVLSYEELDKLHNPNTPTRMYKDREKAEKGLKSMVRWYNITEDRKGRGWSDTWDIMINNFNSDMDKHGLTWDDFVVQEFYLGLIPSTRNI